MTEQTLPQPPTGIYLLLRLIDPQQKHQLGQKHGRRCVWVDAPGVGLEASEAGQHQDREEEGQHGGAQRGVCDQGQSLQIPLQLLLKHTRENEMNWSESIWENKTAPAGRKLSLIMASNIWGFCTEYTAAL